MKNPEPADRTGGMERLAQLSRREVLTRGAALAGWGAFGVVLLTGAVETIRFFFPRVIFRPPSRFEIGLLEEFLNSEGDPDQYGVILVDERWKSTQRFFVVRDRERVYATSARCTHLGCTINWFEELRAFKCPCHGSEFHSNGVNFAGPAPRPLDRFRIELTAEGELIVDTAVVYGLGRFDVEGALVRL
jgi:cytochrome b6-f complex iron-sulfur subunit